MIACISPSELDIQETLTTLQYASRARAVQNKVSFLHFFVLILFRLKQIFQLHDLKWIQISLIPFVISY